jgi:hypothetical protein
LSRTVTPVNGKRAGDIRRVAFYFSTGINQQKIAITQFAVIVYVVENGGVGAGSDNRCVRWTRRAVTPEILFKHRLDFVFLHPRPHGFHRFDVRLRGDVRCLLHYLELFGTL